MVLVQAYGVRDVEQSSKYCALTLQVSTAFLGVVEIHPPARPGMQAGVAYLHE